MTNNLIKTDVVVAGSGGTGLAAAYAAASQGLKVTVIEKQAQIGGNTKISTGFFAVDSKEQQAAGIHLSKDEAVQRLMKYHHFLANGPLIKRIVNSAADTLDWLESIGMEIHLNPTLETTQFAHRHDDYQGGSYHMYQNKPASYERILANLKKIGVNFIYNVTMQDLIFENGVVKGIKAVNSHGEDLTIQADATIVATGGFGGNKQRVADVMKTPYLRTIGTPNMGEGLDAMVKVGGKNIDATPLIHAATLPKVNVTNKIAKKHLVGFQQDPLTQLMLSPLLWVTMSGKRFTNEDVVYDTVEWANSGWSVGAKYYFIVDTATLEDYSTNGGHVEVSKAGPGADNVSADFVDLANKAVQEGRAFKGNTLAELAQNTNFDTNDFKQTISQYNQIIEAKNDPEFGKSAKSLIYPVKQGPYYAFTTQINYLGTIGGVRVNDHLQVLDGHMKPIPGLYTGGANAGGYYEGHSYPAYEGLASGFSWTSGRIAGTSAAEYVKKNND
ncbi:FAD-dependent oxidoreductase [Secundilactobacillus pentosiphilus]|nr:FAD-dependent oxidoreductase [Secundilactobacillus pentosiphilus]